MEETPPISQDIEDQRRLAALANGFRSPEELPTSTNQAPSQEAFHLPGLGHWMPPNIDGVASITHNGADEKNLEQSDAAAVIPPSLQEAHTTESTSMPISEAKPLEEEGEPLAADGGDINVGGPHVLASQQLGGIHCLDMQNDQRMEETKEQRELSVSSPKDPNSSLNGPTTASSDSAVASSGSAITSDSAIAASGSAITSDSAIASSGSAPFPTGSHTSQGPDTTEMLSAPTETPITTARIQSPIEHTDQSLSSALLPSAVSSTPEASDTTKDLERPMPDAPEAEFEVDSSPYESSSDDSSETSDDDDYVMLDAAEQARLLMEGDAGSDDEGRKPPGDHQLRTTNEQPDEVVEMPNVLVTSDTAIEDLGHVENTIANVILVSAKTSGEYQVLESGSVLCLEDRKVIGVVSETLGRVEQPFYSVRFPNPSSITDIGISKNTRIYYIPQYSTFVFTKALQAVKGSDASNLHDEEVAADEQDFSDDEAETAYKRAKKEKKHGRPSANAADPGFSRRPRGGHSGGPRTMSLHSGHNDVTDLPYDDQGDEELYTPLSRPPDLYQGPVATTEIRPGIDQQARPFPRPNGSSRGRGDHRDQHGPTSERGRHQRGRGNAFSRGHDGCRESHTTGRPRLPPQLNTTMAHTLGAASPTTASPSYYGSPSTPSYAGFPVPSPQTASFHQQQFGQMPMPMPYPTASHPSMPATTLGYQPPYQPAHQAAYQSPQQQYFAQQGYAPHPSGQAYGHGVFPPGAFVNPAFWNGAQPAYAAPHGSMPGNSYHPNDQTNLTYSNQAPAEGTAAFQAVQERLDVLKRL